MQMLSLCIDPAFLFLEHDPDLRPALCAAESPLMPQLHCVRRYGPIYFVQFSTELDFSPGES